MTDHDPLCSGPMTHRPGINCDCDLIARVVARERARYQGRREDMMRALTEELLNVRADLHAKVEALPRDAHARHDDLIPRRQVLALFDGSSDE